MTNPPPPAKEEKRHTPTPWEVDVTIYEHMCAGLRGADGAPVGQVWRGRHGYSNANHIVHCVNLHDELVAALERAMEALRGSVPNEWTIHDELAAVLLKARVP